MNINTQPLVLKDFSVEEKNNHINNKEIEKPEINSDQKILQNEENIITRNHVTNKIEENIKPNNKFELTYEQIEELKKTAFNEGYSKSQTANIDNQNIHQSNLENLLNSIKLYLSEFTQRNLELSQQNIEILTQISMHLVKKLLPKIKEDKIEFIEKYIIEIIKLMDPQSELELYINPIDDKNLLDSLNNVFNKHNIENLLKVKYDNDLAEGNFQLKWSSGYMEYNIEEIFTKLEKTLHFENNQIGKK